MTVSQQLWADYLFLTSEMERFVGQDGDEIFFDLLEQRERLQKKIDEVKDNWLATPEGQALYADVSKRNTVIVQYLKAALSRMKRQQEVSQAYDGYGATGSVGGWLDQKR